MSFNLDIVSPKKFLFHLIVWEIYYQTWHAGILCFFFFLLQSNLIIFICSEWLNLNKLSLSIVFVYIITGQIFTRLDLWVALQVSYTKQEVLILPEYMGSPWVFCVGSVLLIVLVFYAGCFVCLRSLSCAHCCPCLFVLCLVPTVVRVFVLCRVPTVVRVAEFFIRDFPLLFSSQSRTIRR